MTEEDDKKIRQVSPMKQRTRRRYLHPVIRYLIIALWGIALGGLIFYFLRKIGY